MDLRETNIYELIMNNAQTAFVLIDKNFNIIYSNDYIKELTGFNSYEVLNKKCFNYFGTGKICVGCSTEKCINTKEKETHVKMEKTRDGKTIYIEVISVPIINESTKEVDMVLEIICDRTNEYTLMERQSNEFTRLVEVFGDMIDIKDPNIANHSHNVRQISDIISDSMKLSPIMKRNIYISASLHDIGKIGISDIILNKPGRLNYDEFNIIKTHPEIGAKILFKIDGFENIGKFVLHHHEKYDGSGYPNKLIGDNIPLESRIISIADSFDAMISSRVYKASMSIDSVVEELIKCKGTHFDPIIVDIVLANLSRICNIYNIK